MSSRASLNRRDFLLLRLGSGRTIELSCEQLLMRYLDAQLHGTTSELFARLDDELRNVTELRVVDPEWLTRQDLAADVERVLDAFRARGGRIAIE